MGKGALPGKGLGRQLQGEIQVPMLKEKRDRFGLGFRPVARQRKKEIEKKSMAEWGRSQVGIDDIPSHIADLCIRRDNSPEERIIGK
ncbi:cytochrome P450 CYP749A22-like protein [Gossypium australe]|uniref:Cytochrome P450 CYP749A22-like protein n=1 Tax=Gossypium australe TaxID=47621 RepID=A0A5B6UYH4_9ROSI|nr:cytochrome P450 CYP749A22-like protein [Gossypium australe]